MTLYLFFAFIRPSLAHDCTCECFTGESVVTFEVVVDVPTDFQKTTTPETPIESVPVVEVSTTEPKHYALMQDMHVGTDGITYITLGKATPNFLIDHALDGKVIKNEWLAPLSCDELDRVEDALYARHKVDFQDDADKAFFAAATIGVYTPEPMRTPFMAEVLHFESVDKLTQLRVNRAQASANCSN